MRLLTPLLTTLLVFGLGSAAQAEPKVISATEAHELLRDDKIVMLDIRTEDEWEETGLAQGAWPVSMHRDDFVQHLRRILSVYRPDQIALICATGGRSAHIAKVLERAGVIGVLDVSESMLGNKNGPGWLKRGLPVIGVDAALADYQDTMRAHQN